MSLRDTLMASRGVILAELALVLAAFAADQAGLIVFSKTLYLLVLACLSLWGWGVGWRGVGLTLKGRWPLILALGLLGGAAIEALELFVTQPLLVRLTGEPPDLSDFKALVGNTKYLLLGLALTWTLAAFGEEMVYRGWLMNRLAQLLGGRRPAWIASLALISVLFGFAHGYQGMTGVVENALDGLWLGLIYLAAGRNLMAPVIAHGITDTIDLLLIWSNHYPTPV
jgi:membrane protease YdiL (CAAX protease family)